MSAWGQAGQRAVDALDDLKTAADAAIGPPGPEQSTVVHLGDLKRIDVREGDVFVLLLKDQVSMAHARQLSDYLSRQFGGHPVAVLDQGADLAVIRREQLDAEET